MPEKISIRRAEPLDIRAVFELSNDPVVRANSIHPEPISWETHVAWFNKSIADPAVIFFVAEDARGSFVGQIRFNRRGEHWIVSISIATEFRGQGLSAALLRDAMAQIPDGSFIAEIASGNEASKRLFASAGFVEDASLNPPTGFQSFIKVNNA